jgi:hypothetical protein
LQGIEFLGQAPAFGAGKKPSKDKHLGADAALPQDMVFRRLLRGATPLA